MANHVIIGAGPAGINAIETIRRFDSAGGITLISDEHAYARMALPYFLAREIGQEQLATASAEYFERLRVDCRVGRRATGIDAGERRVRLDDGQVVRFDTLLIATGSSPLRPTVAGVDGRHVHTLWTLADALALMKSTRAKRPSVVLVGAGFIGLIILNVMHRLGWKVAVVELEGRVLPRMLDRRAGEVVGSWLRAKGVEVYTGCTVCAIEGARRKVVTLSDGRTITASAVILSTGVRPNTGFLDGSGVEVREGVVVGASMQSSVPGVYAAGDVAQGPGLLGGPPAIHAIQTTAVDQGRVAGANMAGHPCTYAGSLRANVLGVAGLHCASFGAWQDGGDTTEVWNPGRPVYRKLVWEGTRIVGGIVVGPVEDTTMLTDVGMLKGLIQSRVDLGRWKRYLHGRPWDLRRAYLASGAPAKLLPQTTLGLPARARGFRFGGVGPASGPGLHHEVLTSTIPAGFRSLPPTPTPGIYKAPPGPREPGRG